MARVVPASYHEFFGGCANVAGALVGLLFVAISVSPEKLTGPAATTAFQIRAAAAFSALVNALVITLFALLPDTNLGYVALATGISGLASTAGIVLLQAREPGRRRPQDFVVAAILVVVFGDQLYNAARLLGHPAATDPLQAEAILVVVCFLVGIARAWELLGVRRTGLVHTAIAIKRAGAAGAAPGDGAGPDEQPTRPS
jgi:hypothetical protein